MTVIKLKECTNCKSDHEWDFEGPTLKEARLIKKLTGLTLKGFEAASEEMDPDAFTAIIDILHRRDGIVIPFDDIDLDFSNLEMVEEEDSAAGKVDTSDFPKGEFTPMNGQNAAEASGLKSPATPTDSGNTSG